MPDVLPDSRCARPLALKEHRGLMWQALFCVSCGTDKGGGWVPDNGCFAMYICDPCYAKYGHLLGTMVIPDAIFWETVRQTQLESFGRLLSNAEIAEALKDSDHILTKLARDRPK